MMHRPQESPLEPPLSLHLSRRRQAPGRRWLALAGALMRPPQESPLEPVVSGAPAAGDSGSICRDGSTAAPGKTGSRERGSSGSVHRKLCSVRGRRRQALSRRRQALSRRRQALRGRWRCTQQPIPCTSRALLSVDKMAAATKARAHQHLCTLQSFCHRFCFVAFLLLLLFLLSLVPFLLDIDWRLPWRYQAWGKRPNYPTCYFDSFCH